MKKLILLLVLFMFMFAHGQSLINGSLESTAAPWCYDNLSNGAFNGDMPGANAYGGASELDIYWQNGCWYFPATAFGDWFTVLDVMWTSPLKYDALNLKLTSALVTGKTYSLSVWTAAEIHANSVLATPITVGISTKNNTQGTIIDTIPAPPKDGQWHNYIITFTCPISGILYISFTAAGDTTYRWTAIDNIELSQPQPLPVELISFTGKRIDNSILLHWDVASEINNDYYTVLRADSSYVFFPILKINGAGYASMERNYFSSDYSPEAGINYYKLIQTDYDGTVKELATIAVFYKGKKSRDGQKYYLDGRETIATQGFYLVR